MDGRTCIPANALATAPRRLQCPVVRKLYEDVKIQRNGCVLSPILLTLRTFFDDADVRWLNRQAQQGRTKGSRSGEASQEPGDGCVR